MPHRPDARSGLHVAYACGRELNVSRYGCNPVGPGAIPATRALSAFRSQCAMKYSGLAQSKTTTVRAGDVASTDCGLGGLVHPQIAWAKLDTVVKGAELATSQLWG